MSGITETFFGDGKTDGAASESLLPIVYEELRRLAASRMRRESGSQTLQPTALVHEAWLRLAGAGSASWRNRAHFFGAAAQAMRRVLVDRAREKSAIKRQPAGEFSIGGEGVVIEQEDHILMIHEALKRLEIEDPEGAKVVLLKFYSGLNTAEIAQISNRAVRSVERQWSLARTRLYQIICEEGFGAESL
jgi:RNA polymerase sigma factor (TIGR02999 family)